GEGEGGGRGGEGRVLGSARVSAYLALGEPERALPMLERSAQDFPEDYNPPARMAVALLALREPSLALEAARRAEKLVYGPRKLRVLLTKAEAEARTGDAHAARVTLAHAEKLVESLPDALRSKRMKGAIAAKRKAPFEPATAPRAPPCEMPREASTGHRLAHRAEVGAPALEPAHLADDGRAAPPARRSTPAVDPQPDLGVALPDGATEGSLGEGLLRSGCPGEKLLRGEDQPAQGRVVERGDAPEGMHPFHEAGLVLLHV